MSTVSAGIDLKQALAEIAAAAPGLDAQPRFPTEAFSALAGAGVLGSGRGVAEQWSLVRAVARADGSVGRILDGHLNGVERVGLLGSPHLDAEELEAVACGRLLLGVWGADPVGGEGEGDPAILASGPTATMILRGSKTFCSGAGGVDRALVLARSPAGGAPSIAYLDTRDERCIIDRAWYRAAGLRASESHRVSFDGAPVMAVLGDPGELGREPWFGRDALRTTAHWAGLADAGADAALHELAARHCADPLAALAAGRIAAARTTIDAVLAQAAQAVEADPDEPTAARSVMVRSAVAGAAGAILDEAARACGARPFAVGGALDRARRDLELFVVQHRLDPLLARVGAQLLRERREERR